jgi:hypothetical protein
MLHNQDGQLKREKFERWLEDLGVKGVLVNIMPSVSDAFVAAMPDPEDADEAEAEDEDAKADPT